jgi:hypothetical protein
VRVFVNSVHLLAAAWVATVVFLWMSVSPARLAGEPMLAHVLIPALALEAFALGVNRWIHSLVGTIRGNAAEWGVALVWVSFPAALLLVTALGMRG